MKRVVIFLMSILSGAILLVFLLHRLSIKNDNVRNGFVRTIKGNVVRLVKSADLTYNSFYLAGLTRESIFLGNYKATSTIIQTDYNFNQLKKSIFINSDTNKIIWPKVSAVVDSPDVYFTEGITPAILSTTLTFPESTPYIFERLHFSQAIPLGKKSFILRAFDNSENQFQLAKTVAGSVSVKNNPAILEKQTDGIFDVDGMLSYEKTLHQFVYVYFYRNQFISLDTNLNLQYRASTIDTCSQVKITTTMIRSDRKMVLASPPLIVNKQSCVDGNFIYIRSALKADNDDARLFNTSSVIDIYEGSNGKYRFSFYLPDFDNKKINAFRVAGDKLIAIYSSHICTYKLSVSEQ